MKKPVTNATGLLPDKGSNLDIQIQNLSYYHYTIGQWDGKDKNFKGIEQAGNGQNDCYLYINIINIFYFRRI